MPKTESAPPPVTRLRDYRPPAHRIVETALDLDLDADETRVRARHQVRRQDAAADLVLDAEADMLQLHAVRIDGEAVPPGRYRMEGGKLVIKDAPAAFELAIENTTFPARNTALSGLYQSGGMLCTQCEAEGFRRIAPAIDRPDNLAAYTVTLRADAEKFPLLLCNGNLTGHGDLGGGRHYATWHDPFPKPTYLFAIVAGDLARLDGHFTTRSKRRVALRFFARVRDIGKCAHALQALKKAMAWDEAAYGREYDLDLFNVVAVGDFNMGAMENKSLNIFNTRYVLADPAVATDADFENVEAVIGHEYFHNWSGNRVTCRDWFQLSLKEGFTVFREQQFSADMGSAAVKRIEDVAALRDHQFQEDAGPMAHPVRPDSYLEINNFYTATVYNKGAEVIRMLHTLLGAETFRRGTDLYFDRHDGQAATTDDFVAAMQRAAGLDLAQFKRWYDQAGTPVVEVETAYDAARAALQITLSQHCPPTPQQPRKEPFVIPVRAALFDRHGRRIAARLKESAGAGGATAHGDDLLVLSEPRQSFLFEGVGAEPVASLLRNFSAPVELRHALSDSDLALLLAHDDDPFNRWEAGQKLFLKHLVDGVSAIQAGRDIALSDTVVRAVESVLDQADNGGDAALQAEILTLPSEAYLSEALEVIDPAAVFGARRALKRRLATALKAKIAACYHRLNRRNDGTLSAGQVAGRRLRDACLGFLAALDEEEVHALAARQLAGARCMTDAAAALAVLAHSGAPQRRALLDDFYARWKDEPLVVDRWLHIQATAARPETLSRVEKLTEHAAFDSANPNKIYALIIAFCHANPVCFHRPDGAGYRFARKWVAQLDPLNPQLAARLVSAFTRWRKYTPELKSRMQSALREIAELPKLSADVAEIVGKSLGDRE